MRQEQINKQDIRRKDDVPLWGSSEVTDDTQSVFPSPYIQKYGGPGIPDEEIDEILGEIDLTLKDATQPTTIAPVDSSYIPRIY